MYRDRIIWLEIGLIEIKVKGRKIVVLFDILLLGKDEAVLGILFLEEFNPKID